MTTCKFDRYHHDGNLCLHCDLEKSKARIAELEKSLKYIQRTSEECLEFVFIASLCKEAINKKDCVHCNGTGKRSINTDGTFNANGTCIAKCFFCNGVGRK